MQVAKRAKVACRSCHARRVKCDAATTQPCWHCQLRGNTCELLESRRGKYTRKRNSVNRDKDQPAGKDAEDAGDSASQSRRIPTLQATTRETDSDTMPTFEQTITPPTTGSHIGDDVLDNDQLDEGPEMLYARMVETRPSQPEPNFQTENVRSFYMGESFSLSFVAHSIYNNPLHAPSVKRHYPIPQTVAEHAHDAAEGLKDSDPATISYLEMRGSFSLPPQNVSDELIRVFFTSFHPAYPVFDRRVFCAQYRQGRVSFLVLQTIFFLAFTSCSDDLLERAGYQSRLTARRTCYLRAKALYDMDYEKDKSQLTAVLFLLGFWWEGPEDQKDTWHWLGSAISLAQTLGMHRSTANSGMPPQHRSMWKRIWWSIYTRDRHAAAALGRPLRIRDEDCDVEMLDENDFLVDLDFDDLFCEQHDFHIMYSIEMSKLAIILGKILSEQFTPRQRATDDTQLSLSQELVQFESQLPLQLRRQPVDEELTAPFWSSMLHASYHNCQILLYRPEGPQSAFMGELERNKKAIMAADLTTRIAEDLLAVGTLSYGQLHLVPAIFAALSIHSVVTRYKDPIRRQLAENRARQCMLAMSELAKSWPVAGWILRLFINLMKRLTRRVGQEHRPDRNGQNRREESGTAGAHLPSSATQSRDFAMQVNPDLNPAIHQGCGSGQFGTQVEDWSDVQQTDQLLSDVIWAPDQANFDFDLLFQGQTNGSLPFNFGSLAETALPDYVG